MVVTLLYFCRLNGKPHIIKTHSIDCHLVIHSFFLKVKTIWEFSDFLLHSSRDSRTVNYNRNKMYWMNRNEFCVNTSTRWILLSRPFLYYMMKLEFKCLILNVFTMYWEICTCKPQNICYNILYIVLGNMYM